MQCILLVDRPRMRSVKINVENVPKATKALRYIMWNFSLALHSGITWDSNPSEFILSTFLGPLHNKNTQSWIEFWNSIFQKKNVFCANKSRYCLNDKKKTSCVSLSIYIFSHLTYTMKDEINKQIAFPQRLKKYSLMLYAV